MMYNVIGNKEVTNTTRTGGQIMFKVIAYAETIEGEELRITLKDCETEEQADKFCDSDDLCNNETIIKLCSYYPDLAPWDFLHMILKF